MGCWCGGDGSAVGVEVEMPMVRRRGVGVELLWWGSSSGEAIYICIEINCLGALRYMH